MPQYFVYYTLHAFKGNIQFNESKEYVRTLKTFQEVTHAFGN